MSLLDVKNRLSFSFLHELFTFLKPLLFCLPSGFSSSGCPPLPSSLTLYDNIYSLLMLFRLLIQLRDSPESPLNSCCTELSAMLLKNSWSVQTKPLAASRKLLLAVLTSVSFFVGLVFFLDIKISLFFYVLVVFCHQIYIVFLYIIKNSKMDKSTPSTWKSSLFCMRALQSQNSLVLETQTGVMSNVFKIDFVMNVTVQQEDRNQMGWEFGSI